MNVNDTQTLSLCNQTLVLFHNYHRNIETSIKELGGHWFSMTEPHGNEHVLHLAKKTLTEAYNNLNRCKEYNNQLLFFRANLEKNTDILNDEAKLFLKVINELLIPERKIPQIPLLHESKKTYLENRETKNKELKKTDFSLVILDSLAAEDILKERTEYCKRIIVLFLQDYVYPESKNPFQSFIQLQLSLDPHPFIEKIVKLYLSEALCDLDLAKIVFKNILHSFTLFFDHLTKSFIHTKSFQARDLIGEMAKRKKSLSFLLNNLEIQDFLEKTFNHFFEHFLFSLQNKFSSEFMAYLSLFFPKISHHLAKKIFLFLNESNPDIIDQLLSFLLNAKHQKHEFEKSFYQYNYLFFDKKFSHEVGDCIIHFLENSLFWAKPQRFTSWGDIPEKIIKKSKKNVLKLGNFFNESIHHVIYVPITRIKIAYIATQILWKQEGHHWMPYKDLKNTSKISKTAIEEKLYLKIQSLIKEEIQLISKKSLVKGVFLKAGSALADVEGSSEIYMKELSKNLYKVLSQPLILITSLIYICESFEKHQ